MDQALGLRRAAQAKREAQTRLGAPLVHAHLLLSAEGRVQAPPCTLLWHWRDSAHGRVGWDLQGRLQVVGLPHQFSALELSQWRTLFREWWLCGRALEIMTCADVGWIWLNSGQKLLERLRPALHWLCRNQPEIPIILAGLGESSIERIQRWASARFPLQFLRPDALYGGAERKRDGYYRLLRLCHAPPISRSSRRLYESFNARSTGFGGGSALCKGGRIG